MKVEAMLDVLSTLDAISKARSEKDYYDIALKLIRYAAPLEIAALVDDSAVTYEPFKDWLSRLYADLTQDNPRLARFDHHLIPGGLSFYTGGSPNKSKTLIIAFCTGTYDLSAPTSLVLQYFSEITHDVLVIRDAKAVGFTEGVPGYASPLTAAIDRLRVDFSTDSYAGIRCFGTSGGGAPALLTGTLLGAQRSVSICGGPPASGPRGKTPGSLDLERALRNCVTDPVRTIAAFAENHSGDAIKARGLARLVDLTLMPVPNLAEHNILKPLLRRGDLAGFFKSIGLT